MRTARLLPVSPSMHCPRRVCLSACWDPNHPLGVDPPGPEPPGPGNPRDQAITPQPDKQTRVKT